MREPQRGDEKMEMRGREAVTLKLSICNAEETLLAVLPYKDKW